MIAPHINGHRTASTLFWESIKELESEQLQQAIVMPSLPSGFEIKLMPNEVMREGVAVMLVNPKDYKALEANLSKRGNGA